MKTFLLITMALIFSYIGFAQNNQSFNGVLSSINIPIPQQFGGQEIFRFQPGLVTQLGAGSTSFNFNQQWFSIGELNTGSQMVYGLRFQLPNKSLTFGYQDTSDVNPRIQWIGQEESLGDLEFRVANSFTTTTSDLVATMFNDSRTLFGLDNPSFPPIFTFSDSKVGIFDLRFDKALKILQDIEESENPTYGVDVFSQTTAPEIYGYNATISESSEADQIFGYNASIEGESGENHGFRANVQGTASRSFGFRTRVIGNASSRYGVFAISDGENGSNFGVFGSAQNASTNYGIYGIVPTNSNGNSQNPGDFAGFFEGDVEVTGNFAVTSDRKFKENIKDIDSAIESLNNLMPRTYNFIDTNKIVLSQGKQYGFIAQELEEIFPELIKEVKKPVFDNEGNITEYLEYKSVNYIGLISVLTASIQELSKEVEDLKATNNSYLVYSDRLSSEEQKRLESLAYKLEQNYPNPFNGKSIIEYSLPDDEQNASIMVLDSGSSASRLGMARPFLISRRACASRPIMASVLPYSIWWMRRLPLISRALSKWSSASR